MKWGIVKIKKHELYSLDISFENRILLVSISRRLASVFTFCSRNRSRKHLYLYRHCGRPLCAEMKEAVKTWGDEIPLYCVTFLSPFFSFFFRLRKQESSPPGIVSRFYILTLPLRIFISVHSPLSLRSFNATVSSLC